MFYVVVCEGMPTVYVHEMSDVAAMVQARKIERSSGNALRLVFVSAFNDSSVSPSGMREVFNHFMNEVTEPAKSEPECDCGMAAGFHERGCEILSPESVQRWN
jgi:hypothetical protein